MAFGCKYYKYYLLTYLLVLCHHSGDALVAHERLHRSAFRHFCNAVVWIPEIVYVKNSWKLVEINLSTLY